MELYVYEGEQLQLVGLVEVFSQLRCAWNYDEPGRFSLRAPIQMVRLTDDTMTYLKPGQWLWPQGRREIYIVESVELTEVDGEVRLEAQGRTASALLARRVVADAESYSGTHAGILQQMFDSVFQATERQFPGFAFEIDTALGSIVTYDTTPLTLLSAVQDLCRAAALGFVTQFNHATRALTFHVFKGANRSGDPHAEDWDDGAAGTGSGVKSGGWIRGGLWNGLGLGVWGNAGSNGATAGANGYGGSSGSSGSNGTSGTSGTSGSGSLASAGVGGAVVIFDPEYENIAKLHYTDSDEDFANVAYIEGETKKGVDGAPNEHTRAVYDAVKAQTGTASAGYSRYELQVNYRPVRADISDPYTAISMTECGRLELKKHARATELVGEMNGCATLFVWGEDYDIGDIVTIRSKEWRVSKTGRVKRIEENWNDGVYTALITVGDNLPTISEKINRELNNVKKQP